MAQIFGTYIDTSVVLTLGKNLILDFFNMSSCSALLYEVLLLFG